LKKIQDKKRIIRAKAEAAKQMREENNLIEDGGDEDLLF